MPYPDPPEAAMTSRMQALSNVLGVYDYSLPEIQRDYSWKTSHAEELLEDLIRFHESGNDWYFIGSIVELDDNNPEPKKLIDGQQRFSTLTVFFCAMRDFLYWKSHEREKEYLQQIATLEQTTDQREDGEQQEDVEEGEQQEDVEEGEQQDADEEELTLVPFVGDDMFITPKITHENTNFVYKEGHHNRQSIEDLARFIDGQMIVRLDEEEPVVRLKLKGNDEIRLKFLQNPSSGVIYNHGLNNARVMPPGRLDPENPESVEHSRSRIYDNYDLFLNEINRKFDEFGTTVQYKIEDENGDYIPHTIQLPGQEEQTATGIMHTEDQLSAAFSWLDSLFVMCMKQISLARMTVTDWPSAYEIFVSTNSKGKALTLTDTVRAMIISRLQREAEEDLIVTATANLDRVANEIGKDEHDSFMRYHWISRNSQKESKSQIAKIISRQINELDAQGILGLTEQISDDVDHYIAVTNPAEDTELGLRRKYFNGCSVRQHIPIMMAAERNENYGDEDKASLHKLVESLFVAHNVTRDGSPSKYETFFAEACSGVNGGIEANAIVLQIAEQAREEIFPTYTRQQFQRDFSKISGETRGVNQFILRSIQTHLWHENNPQGGEAMVQYLIGPNVEVNIEHILPQKIRGNTTANRYWQDRFGEHDGAEHKQNLEKIGNLTLLDKLINQQYLKNREFPYKLANGLRAPEVGEEVDEERMLWSRLEITNQLAEYEHWTPETIEHRGEWLAGLAGEIWAQTLGLIEEPEIEQDGDAEAGEGQQEDGQGVGAEGDVAIQEAIENGPADQEE